MKGQVMKLLVFCYCIHEYTSKALILAKTRSFPTKLLEDLLTGLTLRADEQHLNAPLVLAMIVTKQGGCGVIIEPVCMTRGGNMKQNKVKLNLIHKKQRLL